MGERKPTMSETGYHGAALGSPDCPGDGCQRRSEAPTCDDLFHARGGTDGYINVHYTMLPSMIDCS